MVSLEDCYSFSGLSPEEIQAIAEFEAVPDVVAAQIGAALVKTPQGTLTLQLMLLRSAERARHAGHRDKAARMSTAYSRSRAKSGTSGLTA